MNNNHMGPISDYRQLLDVVKYNQREKEQWYILMILNPFNKTPAVEIFLSNYEYLNDRTGNVRYFIPGFINSPDLRGEIFDSNFKRIEIYENASFLHPLRLLMIFNRKGMLDTVNWLESSSPSYEYREGIDLILMKSYGRDGDAKLDVRNLICISLDNIYQTGGNIIDAITYVRRIVRQNLPFYKAKKEIQSYLADLAGTNQQSEVKVFIAGSKVLHHERNAVRSQLQQISNRTEIPISSYTYEDFSRHFVEDGQQAEYDKFIANQADFAIIIIDGRLGGITFNEFNVAMSAFKEKGSPQIFVYCKDIDTDNPEIKHIIDEINSYRQYFCEYNDLNQLESGIRRDFMDIVWELRR